MGTETSSRLTEFGADQAFELGVAVRARYPALLAEIETRDLVSAQTASTSRSQQTLQHFLEGLHYSDHHAANTPKTQQLILNDTLLNSRSSGCVIADSIWEPIHKETLPFLAQWKLSEKQLLE